MDWQDTGYVLGARRYGENDAIAEILTVAHGRHLGIVKAGMSKAKRAELQPGNEMAVTWAARLEEHLGRFDAEPLRALGSRCLDDRFALAALASACAVASAVLPEREPHAAAAEAFGLLAEACGQMQAASIAALAVRWELGLLAELGFGIDLARCAVTGSTDDLAFVSPRSGRAVSRAGAAGYEARLLRLPLFLLGNQSGEPDTGDLSAGVALAGHFLESRVLRPHGKALPGERSVFAEAVSRL
jgi:DNA repair protein RecO (recombination protein O)